MSAHCRSLLRVAKLNQNQSTSAEHESSRIQPTTGNHPVNCVGVWSDIKANSVLSEHPSGSIAAAIPQLLTSSTALDVHKIAKRQDVKTTVASLCFIVIETFPVHRKTGTSAKKWYYQKRPLQQLSVISSKLVVVKKRNTQGIHICHQSSNLKQGLNLFQKP